MNHHSQMVVRYCHMLEVYTADCIVKTDMTCDFQPSILSLFITHENESQTTLTSCRVFLSAAKVTFIEQLHTNLPVTAE